MKKLLIKVDGKQYNVEVEVLEEDDSFEETRQMFNPGFHRPGSQLFQTISQEPTATTKPSKIQRSENENYLESPVNGTILEIYVAVGNKLKEKQIAFSIEAMKMKTNIFSPIEGIVKSVNVKLDDVVEQGQVLLIYE